jgi:hypothetical protein
LIPVPVHQLSVDVTFPKIARFLLPAIEHERCSEWTLDSVYQECLAGRMILFVDDHLDPKNALVARFVNWGGERVLYLAFMGGEGKADWRQAMKHIRTWAAGLGVSRVAAHLREGWTHYFKSRRLVALYEIEE